MAISEMKMQMVIDNYFKDECDTNTSIRQAFEKGFRIGVKKGVSMNRPQDWIPCSEKLPSEEDCPMDCMVTRRGKFMGNYVDMAVAERNGTWTHEDWAAIVLGDVESGRKTGLISTRDDEIIAWMPLPEPYSIESDGIGGEQNETD